MARELAITVAIPTCNRPIDVDRCLVSLAATRYRNWRLMVIDQSDGDETRELLNRWRKRLPEIGYLHVNEKNVSGARNVAIDRASGDVLAFVDDDCTVGPDWLDQVRDAFRKYPEAHLVFGAVKPADHDPTAIFMPAFPLQHERYLTGPRSVLVDPGMGASMYVRLHPSRPRPFDVLLCPGGVLRCGEDWDYAYRALVAGEVVVQTPEIVVTHHGGRPYAGGSAKAKLRDYDFGVGASHAKLLRCGNWIIALAILDRIARVAAAIRPQNALAGRPVNLARLVMYARGLRAGFRTPLDRRRVVFLAT